MIDCGPYDFLPLTDTGYVDMFHGANNKDALPITHVTGPRPPMLLTKAPMTEP